MSDYIESIYSISGNYYIFGASIVFLFYFFIYGLLDPRFLLSFFGVLTPFVFLASDNGEFFVISAITIIILFCISLLPRYSFKFPVYMENESSYKNINQVKLDKYILYISLFTTSVLPIFYSSSAKIVALQESGIIAGLLMVSIATAGSIISNGHFKSGFRYCFYIASASAMLVFQSKGGFIILLFVYWLSIKRSKRKLNLLPIILILILFFFLTRELYGSDPIFSFFARILNSADGGLILISHFTDPSYWSLNNSYYIHLFRPIFYRLGVSREEFGEAYQQFGFFPDSGGPNDNIYLWFIRGSINYFELFMWYVLSWEITVKALNGLSKYSSFYKRFLCFFICINAFSLVQSPSTLFYLIFLQIPGIILLIITRESISLLIDGKRL